MRGAVLTSLVLLALPAGAYAECPDAAADCLLHEDGAALLASGKFQEAAAKFQASIAAKPSARSYLGLALSKIGLGRLAAAHDDFLEAERLATQDVSARPDDDDAKVRLESIKYKLGELHARIGFVRLKLPTYVAASDVVVVSRKGDGDLRGAFERAVPLDETHHTFEVVLGDGRRAELEVALSPGQETSALVPFEMPKPVPVTPTLVDRPAPEPRPVLPRRYGVLLEAAVAPGYNRNAGVAYGPLARMEVRAGPLWLHARGGFFTHGTTETGFDDGTRTYTGYEVPGLAGLRMEVVGPLYVGIEAGLIYFSETVRPDNEGNPESDLLGSFMIGAASTGLRLERFDLGVTLMVASPIGLSDFETERAPPETGIQSARLMFTIGLRVAP